MNASHQTAQLAAKLAAEKMAENITLLDMKGRSGLCDYFVICDTSSVTRSKTVAEHIAVEMKRKGEMPLHRDGHQSGSWIVIDFGDVIVHVFLKEIRQFYNLEHLWGDAPREIWAGSKVKAARKASEPVRKPPRQKGNAKNT